MVVIDEPVKMRWQKMNPCDKGYDDPKCISLPQWRAIVSVVMNFSVPQKVGISLFMEWLLSSWEDVSSIEPVSLCKHVNFRLVMCYECGEHLTCLLWGASLAFTRGFKYSDKFSWFVIVSSTRCHSCTLTFKIITTYSLQVVVAAAAVNDY
jgi:hypothetical protein